MTQLKTRLKIGLLLNPLAGIGGPVGLKGSDGMAQEALRRGSVSRVDDRVAVCVAEITREQLAWYTLAAPMGAHLLKRLGLPHQVVGDEPADPTTAADTRQGVAALADAGVDLLLFAGGDGTARDLLDACVGIPAALGIPCGVKMHSGVFSTTPAAAARLVNKLARGEMLSVVQAEVRDIDEDAFRRGVVKTEFYGEMPVPDDLRYVQQTKMGGREVEDLVIQDMAAEFAEDLDRDTMYILGSGSTIAALMDNLGFPATLLGIDVIYGGELVAADANEKKLLELLGEGRPARILVTGIGGQGHIFGRGNQQLSPEVIRRVGTGNIDLLATRSKLAGLGQRPLLVDTGDSELDQSLAGFKSIITGYRDRVLYRVSGL